MLLLVLLFIVVPIAELWVIIELGGAIGLGPTVLLLFADSVIGAMLLRSQGRNAWIRFNASLAEGRMPGREVFDGVVIIFGGALLLTPGFITDAVGLAFLLPPSRAAIRAYGARHVKRRMADGTVKVWGPGARGPFGAGPFPGAGSEPQRNPYGTRPPGGAGQPRDIDGTAVEIRDEDTLTRGDS